MKRILGLILGLAGLLCLVAAAVLVLATPQFIRLPDQGDLPTAVLEAPGATVMQPGTGSSQAAKGDLRITTRMRADGKTDDGAVIWNASQETVLSGAATPISVMQGRIALDARSGAGVEWSGECLADQPAPCQAGNVRYSGQLYAFPFGTEKKTYKFFDTTVRAALPIDYRGTDTVKGLRTYRFEQTIPVQQWNLDPQTRAALEASLPQEAKFVAQLASMRYQSNRTVWVEPVTGSIVDYREHVQREIVMPFNQPSVPVLDATFQYTEQTRTEIAAEASDGIAAIRVLRSQLPIGLTVVGIVLLAAGLPLLVLSRRSRRKPAVASES
jgi:hypothetical protein